MAASPTQSKLIGVELANTKMIRSTEMERCSFCGKTKDQVERLIQGGGKQPSGELPIVFICNECIGLCAHIIGEGTARPRHENLYEPLTPWAEIELDGERYRWSAARVTMSEHDASGKLTSKARPMVMISVGKIGEPAVGVMYEDGTEPTEELAVEAIRRMRGHM